MESSDERTEKYREEESKEKTGGSYEENEVNYSSNSKLLITKNEDVPRETKGMKGRQKRRG
jgi:hypothetical protein